MTENYHSTTENDEDKLQKLIDWLQTDSFVSSNIEIKEIPGRGRAVIARKPISRDSLLIKIKRHHLLNITTVPRRNERLSAHQQLAWFLYEIIYIKKSDEESRQWRPFVDLMPTMNDFSSIPLVSSLSVAPDNLLEHVKCQEKTFDADWVHVQSTVGKEINRENFLHTWLCVNTRCLFMDVGALENHKDNLTMAPYVDFLNHFDDKEVTVSVRTTPAGMELYTTKGYEPGDEIYLNYGPHDNVFLLCEYGFIFKHNKWDTIDITSSILFMLTEAIKHDLQTYGYLGDYTINRRGLSWRTEIALAAFQRGQADGPVLDMIRGESDGKKFEKKSLAIVRAILQHIRPQWTGEFKESYEWILSKVDGLSQLINNELL